MRMLCEHPVLMLKLRPCDAQDNCNCQKWEGDFDAI
ncbi:hypothetical protein DLJ82_5459 (plasmid) [Rhizobium leguminosarum]|uniref:Uncharacterized protein n=1 Tax=Rhizobium leguminosarum TaxID=384 RepID=A0A2Z4YNL9_RHILE|nr:hypothetical protein DLJ82_5459 [Rhizobium leguminosarum]